ncbi:MAG TPA: hypothetical protein VHS31_08190 [Tepidisphaeraceae bacterium]|jgi:hypothetical protein|nr:hypothetical protein [Tepidisphaeraceae bacterium]
MRNRIRKFAFAMIAPLVSASLLAGIVAEHRRYLKPEDFEPYHVQAKAAIEGLPLMIGSWVGTDTNDVPMEAQVLLKPNKILSRCYSDTSVASLDHPRSVSLLIVQCKLASDMVGHFPPICYPSHGWENMCPDKDEKGWLRDWTVAGEQIPGKEYEFRQIKDGQTMICTVYNFLIVPGRGIVRDIQGVDLAAEDYQQRYYGAAQFQLVFQGSSSDQMSQQERDEIFTTLMEPVVPVIHTLNTTLTSLKSGATP